MNARDDLLARYRRRLRGLVLVRAMNDVISNRCHVVAAQNCSEGDHPFTLESAVQYDVVEEIAAQETGRTQVGNHAARNRFSAVAYPAVLAEEVFSMVDGCAVRGLKRRIDDEIGCGVEWRQRCLAI